MTNRIYVGENPLTLNISQAITLAEFGDVIVVHTEGEKVRGEELARRNKPNVKIDFTVEPMRSVCQARQAGRPG